jgi:PilZ domain
VESLMPELRNAPRSAAKHQGKAIISGREIACTIRDLSALGARLNFAHPTFLPRQFRLVFDEGDQKVTVMWQAGGTAGVRFQTPLRHLPRRKKRTWPWSK